MESRKPMLPWMDAVRSSRSCEWEQCDGRERPLARAHVQCPVSRRDGGGARDRRAVAYRVAGLTDSQDSELGLPVVSSSGISLWLLEVSDHPWPSEVPQYYDSPYDTC